MNTTVCRSAATIPRILGWVFVLLLFTAPVLQAQDTHPDRLLKRLEELEARLQKLEAERALLRRDSATDEIQSLRRDFQVLAAELERLRSGEPDAVVEPSQSRGLGLGTSAASVYRKKEGVSLAGYGEMVYENFAGTDQRGTPADKTSRLDFLRLVLYAGHRFNDRFIFNSEIEFEHASTGKTGEASVEFAYLDYTASPNWTLRGGLLLVPMGLMNEFHEPNAFLGVRRSETESRIIPSTWRENGFGVLGSAGGFQYRAYLLNGLSASGFTAEGLRGGRQKGSQARATDMAFVGRLDYSPTPGVFVGGSLYTGGAGQDQFQDGSRRPSFRTTIFEIHGQGQFRGLDLRGLYARAMIEDAAVLNRVRGLSGPNSIAEVLQGGYLQAGYNLLSQYRESVSLTPFYRFESVNPHHRLPPGLSPDPSLNRNFHTFGLLFEPHPGIVLKTDYLWIRNKAKTGLNQFNLGLGYVF